jgi:molecular chaperone GrpE
VTDPATPDTDPVEDGTGPVEDPLGPPSGGEVPDAGSDGSDGPDGAGADDAAPDDGAPVDRTGSSVEELIADLERTIGERDEVQDRLARNQADFENAKRRLGKEAADAAERALAGLAEKLLPVLDACDAAIAHDASEVEPVFAALLGTLEKEGLERIAPAGETFDPNLHEAVLHEPADDDADDGTVVSEVLRTGYAWKGRVLRPAMVKVKG